jgi:hypothetical protein
MNGEYGEGVLLLIVWALIALWDYVVKPTWALLAALPEKLSQWRAQLAEFLKKRSQPTVFNPRTEVLEPLLQNIQADLAAQAKRQAAAPQVPPARSRSEPAMVQRLRVYAGRLTKKGNRV